MKMKIHNQHDYANESGGHNTRPSFNENGECFNTNIFKRIIYLKSNYQFLLSTRN
jgi:hypothetical protein